MRTTKTEYYFSTIVMCWGTLLMVIFSVVPSYLFFKFYKDNSLIAIAFAFPLIIVFLGLRDYLRFMYCLITKKPALVLNKTSLINNANGNVYNWNKIKSISYEPHTGPKALPGGYISVILKNPEDKFRIPQNSIKCKTKLLLQDLQQYHRVYHNK